MAVNLESHGLPVGIAYGAPVTVQDQQGQGHGQQPAQDAGYGNTSAFERATPGASLSQVEVQDHEAGGGDLLSKLSGFIRAVGDVVVQVGEYIRSAGGALADGLAGEAAPQAPVQTPAAPAAQAQVQTPALGTPAGAPVPTAPQALAAPAQQLATAAVQPSQPRQTSPSLGTRSSEPTSSRDAAKVSASGVGEAAASTPSAATAGPHGGGRASQSSGYPVLNPLPPYLGDQLAFFDFPVHGQPEAQFPAPGGEAFQGEPVHGPFASMSASARPPVQPTYSVEQAVAVQAAQGTAETQPTNNVIPFPGPAARDTLHGEASNEATGEALQPEADPASP